MRSLPRQHARTPKRELVAELVTGGMVITDSFAELAELAHILTPVVLALAGAVIPYPNPMGVEQFDTT